MTPVKSTSKKSEANEKAMKKESVGLELRKSAVEEAENSKSLPTSLYGKGGVEKLSLTVSVYNQDGQEAGNFSLPLEIFGLKVNANLIAQAARAQRANSRENIAHAKDRSEVRGGGKKPWKQKGTGRARHASIRSPLWGGGGVTFGPRKEKNFAVKINKKMKRQALFMALSGKLRDGELIILEDLNLKEAKTKEMAQIMKNIFGALALARDKSPTKVGTPIRTSSAMIVLAKNDEAVVRATRNLPKIRTIGVNSLNIVDLLSVRYLVMPKATVERIRKIFGK